MTRRPDGRLTAALLLARQAVELLEQLASPAPPSKAPERVPAAVSTEVHRLEREWRGHRYPFTADELAVLETLAAHADADDVCRVGIHGVQGLSGMGRARLHPALAALAEPLPGGSRPPLLAARKGPNGRIEHQMLSPAPGEPVADVAAPQGA